MSLKYLQGKFSPKNPSKYVGDIHRIIFRSSYELAAFHMIDNTSEILKWSSEGTVIPYTMFEGDRMRRYFVDLSILVRSSPTTTQKFLIEIKPSSKTKAPKKTGRMSDKSFQAAALDWAMNSAKWEAARKFCDVNDAKFIIWTEKQIFPDFANLKTIRRIPIRKKPR